MDIENNEGSTIQHKFEFKSHNKNFIIYDRFNIFHWKLQEIWIFVWSINWFLMHKPFSYANKNIETKIIIWRNSPSTSACRPRPRIHAAFLHEQWANRPCGLMYRTIFFFTNSCEPELVHRLQTSKMRRNSTSLDSCQHDDINIVTVSVARRRWTAPLKPRRPCV